MTDKNLLHYLQQFLTPERLERFEEVLDFRTKHITVVLENFFKPHNASAVLRSCDCYGIQEMQRIDRDHVHKINRDITRGAQKWVTTKLWQDPVTCTTDCLQHLKERNYRLIATSPEPTATSLFELDLTEPVAIMFGREKTGLSEEAMNAADECVTIPMFGFTESFNVSVSVALCLNELVHRLHNSDLDWNLTEEEKDEIRLAWVKRCLPNIHTLEKHYRRTQ